MNVILSNATLIYLHKVHKKPFHYMSWSHSHMWGVALGSSMIYILVSTLPQSGIFNAMPIIQMYSEYHPFCQWILGFLQELYVHVKIFFSSERCQNQIYSLSPRLKQRMRCPLLFLHFLLPENNSSTSTQWQLLAWTKVSQNSIQ